MAKSKHATGDAHHHVSITRALSLLDAFLSLMHTVTLYKEIIMQLL